MAPKFFVQGNQAINLDHVYAIDILGNEIRFFINGKFRRSIYGLIDGFECHESQGICYVAFTYESKEVAEYRLRAVLDS